MFCWSRQAALSEEQLYDSQRTVGCRDGMMGWWDDGMGGLGPWFFAGKNLFKETKMNQGGEM